MQDPISPSQGRSVSIERGAALSENPLLFRSSDPIPFSTILPEHIEPAIEFLLRESHEALERIVFHSKPRTFANTVEALDRVEIPLDRAWHVVTHLAKVDRSEELQALVCKLSPKVSHFYSEVRRGDGVWNALVDFSRTSEAKRLSGNQKRLFDLMMDTCRRFGAELSPDKRAELLGCDSEIARLQRQFEDNIIQSRASFHLVIEDEKRLQGLPESAVRAAKQTAAAMGVREGWVFTAQHSSLLPVLRYADDAELRRQLYEAHRTIASGGEYDNISLAHSLLSLRQTKAHCLGKACYADVVLEARMARSPEQILFFLSSLDRATRAGFLAECEMLQQLKDEDTGNRSAPLYAWDTMYYANKMMNRLYHFSKEEMRPYFEHNTVLYGLFELAERLYGITITERPDLIGWHPSVRAFQLRDENGESLGVFYVDLFCRPEKAAGAWHTVVRRHSPEGIHKGEYVGCLSMDFAEPLSGEKLLLTHDQVQTLFHEFGHLMHKVMLEVPEIMLREIPWDYVELPSQLMENFCWNKSVLDTFARHIDTGEVVPGELFSRLRQTRDVRAMTLHQERIARSKLDLKLHTSYDPLEDGDLLGYSRKQLTPHAQSELIPSDAFIASFQHIFSGGYSAGYYSYLWGDALQAEVFDAIFSLDTLPERSQGKLFRRIFLAPGNAQDVMEVFNAFFGRSADAAPSPESLLSKKYTPGT